jgi:beta-lactamase regulating signal transducer with metallopeptidase domain
MPDLYTVPQWASAVREVLPPFAVDLAFASVVVLAAAAVATRVMTSASAAARHLVWCAAVASLILLPALSVALPRWDGLPGWRDASAAAPMPKHLPPLGSMRAAGTDAPAGDALDAGGPVAPPSGLGSSSRRASFYLATIWGIGAAWLLVPLLAGRSAMRRFERCFAPPAGEEWADALRQACAELKLRRRVTLLVGGDVPVPMTWGTWRPRVLLPASSSSWSAERRRVVLLHELGHVARLDCLTHFLAQLVRAVYWFNPLAWLAVSRMRIERERACDDLVLRLGTPGPSYADHLVSIVSALQRRALPWPATAMARSSQVGQRVREILEDRRDRRPVTATQAVAAVVLMLLVTIPVACMKPASGGSSAMLASDGGGGVVPSSPAAPAEGIPAGWTAEQAHAADDLRLLAAALVYYSAEYRGRYPGHPSLLWPGYVELAAKMDLGKTLSPAEAARVFLSPQDEGRVKVPDKPTRDWLFGWENHRSEYVYLGADARQLMGSPHHSTIMLMHTHLKTPFRGADGRETAVAVFFDGHAEILPLPEVRRLSGVTKTEIEKVKPLWAEFERRDKARAATRPAKQ